MLHKDTTMMCAACLGRRLVPTGPEDPWPQRAAGSFSLILNIAKHNIIL